MLAVSLASAQPSSWKLHLVKSGTWQEPIGIEVDSFGFAATLESNGTQSARCPVLSDPELQRLHQGVQHIDVTHSESVNWGGWKPDDRNYYSLTVIWPEKRITLSYRVEPPHGDASEPPPYVTEMVETLWPLRNAISNGCRAPL
jgi:hypothetical protein